jgi:hypothetical protein
MCGIGTSKASWVAAVALSCGGIVLTAWASPPSSRPAGAASHRPHLDLRLDLRPPGAREPGYLSTVSADHAFGGLARTPGSHESNLPALGADAAGSARVMSRAESFARRFHREGLPVARLWENHSALLSLGLNAKGKPGLWLVQKTR